MKKRIVSMLLVLMLLIGIFPTGAFAAEAEGSTSITTYVSISQYGKFVTGKDGRSVAAIPVTLTGKESYTLDDALKAVHDVCYEGGAAAGYASYTHEDYGLSLKTLWGDSSGMFGYQVNQGTATVLGLSHVISNGDHIDAYINQSAYPDNEAYSVFNKSTYKAVPGAKITLKLTQAGYDENWNTVFSGCEGATITVDGVPVTETVDGAEVPVTTNSSGSATFSISEVGTHVVSATKTKIVGGNTATAITAPVCIVTVTQTPRLGSLNISKEWSDGGNYYTLSPAFDPSVTEYSITVPDYTSSVFPYAKLAEGTEGKNICYYGFNGMFGSFVWSSSNSISISGGYFGVVIYDKTNGMSTEDIRYTVNINKHATLQALSVDGVGSLDFNRGTNAGYHYYVDSTRDGVDITATAYKNNYTVTIGGNTATSGEPYHLAYNWDENGKMEVPITVSGDKVEPYTYTVVLEKQPLNDAPYILVQPVEADYIVGDTAKALSVTASANGELAYQWYANTVESNQGGTAIEGATAATYTPSAETVGTVYYYCVITNAGKTENNTTTSEAVRITVDPDPTPKATIVNPGAELSGYDWDTGYVYNVGDEATALTVTAASDAEGGTWSYRWYSVSRPYNISSWSSATGTSNTESYTPATALNLANSAGKYYACRVSYTFKGKTYTSWATTGKTYTEGEGENAKTYDVTAAYVFLDVDKAEIPSITKQPVSASYIEGDSMTNLSVTASRADGGTLSYQWYVNDTNRNQGGTAIEGATSRTYKLGTAAEGGTKYYYCVVTNSIQGYTAGVTSDVAAITVKTVKDLVSDKLSGSGTAEDPYLIADAQDYQDVAELVAGGLTFTGQYLKQTGENITLPENWEPIGVAKTKMAFSGILDGNGKTVTVPEGGLPLLGYVKGATVKNLNIYGKKIAGYGLVNNLEGVGLSGEAICIDNVTLKSGSSTLKAGLIGTYITTNGFAGCSAGFYVTIKNCTIEEGVVIGYNKDQAMIGSIAGRVHGTIDNCVSYATVYGTDYVGGILGTRDNATAGCTVTNCTFGGTVEASGEHAGGIAGGGYSNSTGPNGAKINISGCTVSGSVTGSDKVGGIVGADTYVVQLWGNHTLKNNSFTGTVKATSGTYVGGIIGYYASLNKYDNITGNYYKTGCGTDKGIGYVQYVDTNCATHETASGTTYINTADGESGIGGITKTDVNRTDDPLGADAGKLCYTDSTPMTATELTVSGTYKTEYTKGDALDLTGIVLTVAYNVGKTETITLADVTVTGYDANVVGAQEVTLDYKGLTATVEVKVKNPEGTIKITISILGDSKHDCETDGNIHTLADNNLEAWVAAKEYTVDSNATVLDVLTEIFAANSITVSNPAGSYIESVTRNGVTLKAADNHANSGWMFTVNGVHGTRAVNEQYMQDGDVIIFHHTDDYTKENYTAIDTKVTAVIALIAVIGEVAEDSGDAVKAAREAYDALTDAQKRNVTNYDTLVAAEKAYAELVKTAADAAAAENVEKLIDAIGTVTKDSKQAIEAARKAYDALTDTQKALVENYDALITAENLLAQLQGPSHEEIYKVTGDYIASLGTPNVGSIGGEWMVIGLARSGKTVPAGYYDNVVKYVKENTDENGRLHKSKSTDNARVILALTAIGKDVTDVDGHNLLEGLTDMTYVKKQGINGPIWALIALGSHDYEIPAGGDVTRQKLIDTILAAQLADGGWALSGDAADSDMTGMAIQALAPYCKTDAKVKAAVDKAVAALSAMQNADGSFSTAGAATSESTAQVIVALTALGIDPETDSRFVKNGISAVDALCAYAVEGGGFKHVADGKLDGMATEQGYYALAAYYRFLNSKTSLHDMSDVKIDQDPETPTDPDSPQTGDEFNMLLWSGLMAVSTLAIAVLLLTSRKRSAGKYNK